jgi:hypothetical protein
MTAIPGIDDDRIFITIGPISVKGGEPLTLRIPRLDFLDPDTYDALMDDLEALDVEAQVIAVANDLAETPVGTSVFWEPLLKPARAKLAELGVVVKRIAPNGLSRDEITCPDEKVLKALEPFSGLPVLSLPKRARTVVLAMLKHVLTEDELEACSKMAIGQLNAIRDEWQQKSQVSLGEFLASESS